MDSIITSSPNRTHGWRSSVISDVLVGSDLSNFVQLRTPFSFSSFACFNGNAKTQILGVKFDVIQQHWGFRRASYCYSAPWYVNSRHSDIKSMP